MQDDRQKAPDFYVRESRGKSGYVLYLAVVPVYRDAAIRCLFDLAGDELQIFAGDEHLDATVRTGLPTSIVHRVRNVPLLRRKFLLQRGQMRSAFSADVCVVDLNPRSLNAWAIVTGRRVLHRRTLVWGHLHPRLGASSKTAFLRRLLRRLSTGTVLYGYDSVVPARSEVPGGPVWVAPNALYRKADMTSFDVEKTSILYVGRLETAKNVHLLIEAYARSGLASQGIKLDIVGFGALAESLNDESEKFGVSKTVRYHGRIDDVQTLKLLYESCLFSVSPGYIGLSLTQSLGFGTPMLYPADATHSPEIELKRFGAARSFSPTSVVGLSNGLRDYAQELISHPVDRDSLARNVSNLYSAEAMAEGLWAALEGRPSKLGADGWPLP